MSDQSLQVSAELQAELTALITQGRTIEAIQRLRTVTGCGLKDGKAWVDQRMSTIPSQPHTFSGPLCPYCQSPLATDKAQQCLACGMDWHNPAAPVRRSRRNGSRVSRQRQRPALISLVESAVRRDKMPRRAA